MSEALIIVLALLALIVVVGAIYWIARGRERRLETRREEAAEHRQEAATAAQRAGEADLIARRHTEEAQRERARAIDLEEKAIDRDPDVSRR